MILTADSEVVRQTRRKTERLAHHLHRREPQHAEARPDATRGRRAVSDGVSGGERSACGDEAAFPRGRSVSGGGAGRRPARHARVGTVAVHYTDAWSAYGPIVAADEGIAWFTLRNTWDRARAICQPRASSCVRRACGISSTASRPRRRCRWPRPGNWPSPIGLSCVTVLEQTPDGMATWRTACRRAHASAGPIRAREADSSGSCCRVSLRRAGRHFLPPNSCVFVAPEDGALTMIAGGGGAETSACNSRFWRATEPEPASSAGDDVSMHVLCVRLTSVVRLAPRLGFGRRSLPYSGLGSPSIALR